MKKTSADFACVNSWVFDIDNSLYPAACNLFAQIDARMTGFIENRLGLSREEARKLQKAFYVQYGTTLSGLMHEHNVKPHDFMDYVHDIDLTPISENKKLAGLIKALPGKKYIFTNGSVRHAENVAGKLGIVNLFDGIFDIAAADYKPKPHRAPYEKFIARHGIDPTKAAMFEDMACNLEVPHAMGMRTVLVASDAPWLDDEPASKRPATPSDRHDHVHYLTENLATFLHEIDIESVLSESA